MSNLPSIKLIRKYRRMHELRSQGKTMQAIGEQFGHSRGHVSRCIQRFRKLLQAGMISQVFMLWLCLAATTFAADKPCLDVWCCGSQAGEFQPNEDAFWRAYQEDSGFRTALDQAYHVRRGAINKSVPFCMSQGIRCGPTFVSPAKRIIGFRGADVLLGELGLTRNKPATSSTIDTTAIKADLAKALLQDVQALGKTLRDEQAGTADGLHGEIGSLLNRVEQLEQQMQQADSSLSTGLNGFQCQFEQVIGQLQQLKSDRAAPPPPAASSDSSSGTQAPPVPWLDRSVRIFSAVISIGQLLGVASISAGSFGIAGLVIWGLRRLFSVRPAGPVTPASFPQGNATVADAATPATPAKTSRAEYELVNRIKQYEDEIAGLREQLAKSSQQLAQAQTQSPLYAPYETELFREAYEWSAKEMARKFPGAVDTLESLRNFIDQYLSSKGRKGKA